MGRAGRGGLGEGIEALWVEEMQRMAVRARLERRMVVGGLDAGFWEVGCMMGIWARADSEAGEEGPFDRARIYTDRTLSLACLRPNVAFETCCLSKRCSGAYMRLPLKRRLEASLAHYVPQYKRRIE